jgi:hypothetical protein
MIGLLMINLVSNDGRFINLTGEAFTYLEVFFAHLIEIRGLINSLALK